MTESNIRQDKEGNVYALPKDALWSFDRDCDEAAMAEQDEAIGLWIDIKVKYKNYML